MKLGGGVGVGVRWGWGWGVSWVLPGSLSVWAFLIKVPRCMIRELAKRVFRFGFVSPCRSSERISSGM